MVIKINIFMRLYIKGYSIFKGYAGDLKIIRNAGVGGIK